jgi:hypothetical protein
MTGDDDRGEHASDQGEPSLLGSADHGTTRAEVNTVSSGRLSSSLFLLLGLAAACAADPDTGAVDDADQLTEEELAEYFPPIASGPAMPFDPKAPSTKIVAPEKSGEAEFVTKGLVTRSTQSHAETFRWSKAGGAGNYGEWDVPMKPVRTHVCFLTGVSGDLAGQGSAVAVHRSSVDMMDVAIRIGIGGGSGGTVVNEDGDTWKVAGFQIFDNSLAAESTCVPLADFKLDPGGVRRISEAGRVTIDGCTSGSARMWDKAPAYLSGVQGRFGGGGEYVKTQNDFDNNWLRRGWLKARSERCVNGYVEGNARSIFLGIPGHDTGHLDYVDLDLDAHSHESKSRRLSATADAICYLTRVSGSLDGGGESIRLYPKKDGNTEYWYLDVKAQGGSAYASVSCLLYDQVLPPVL